MFIFAVVDIDMFELCPWLPLIYDGDNVFVRDKVFVFVFDDCFEDWSLLLDKLRGSVPISAGNGIDICGKVSSTYIVRN